MKLGVCLADTSGVGGDLGWLISSRRGLWLTRLSCAVALGGFVTALTFDAVDLTHGTQFSWLGWLVPPLLPAITFTTLSSFAILTARRPESSRRGFGYWTVAPHPGDEFPAWTGNALKGLGIVLIASSGPWLQRSSSGQRFGCGMVALFFAYGFGVAAYELFRRRRGDTEVLATDEDESWLSISATGMCPRLSAVGVAAFSFALGSFWGVFRLSFPLAAVGALAAVPIAAGVLVLRYRRMLVAAGVPKEEVWRLAAVREIMVPGDSVAALSRVANAANRLYPNARCSPREYGLRLVLPDFETERAAVNITACSDGAATSVQLRATSMGFTANGIGRAVVYRLASALEDDSLAHLA